MLRVLSGNGGTWTISNKREIYKHSALKKHFVWNVTSGRMTGGKGKEPKRFDVWSKDLDFSCTVQYCRVEFLKVWMLQNKYLIKYVAALDLEKCQKHLVLNQKTIEGNPELSSVTFKNPLKCIQGNIKKRLLKVIYNER